MGVGGTGVGVGGTGVGVGGTGVGVGGTGVAVGGTGVGVGGTGVAVGSGDEHAINATPITKTRNALTATIRGDFSSDFILLPFPAFRFYGSMRKEVLP